MTTTSTNLGLTLFNSTTDATAQTFLQYRTAVAGVEATSNFNKIDSAIGDMRISVKDFGAVGDGTTDDTSAIQATLDFISTLGGIVYLPKGTYKITSPLLYSGSPISIEGASIENTLIKNFSTTTNCFTLGTALIPATYYKLSNFSISTNSAMTSGTAIDIVYGFNVLLRDVYIHDHFRGIRLHEGSFRYLDHVWVTTDVYTPPSGCIGVEITGGHSDHLSNCYIFGYHYSNNPLSGLRIQNSGGVIASNCTVSQFGDGILIDPGTGQEVAWLFFNNFLCDTNYRSGIKIVPYIGTARGLNFVNCWTSFSGKTDATTGWGAGQGVEILHYPGFGILDGVSFSEHRSLKNAQHGFYVGGGDNVSIFNSVVSGNSQQTPTTYGGITVVADINRFRIIGNRVGPALNCEDYQGAGVIVAAGTSDYYIISNNDTTGNVTTLTDGGTGVNKVVANNLI